MLASLLAIALTVDAAASLQEPFLKIAQRFEKAHPGSAVTLQFGGSQELRTRIENGQRIDVVATADTRNMDPLARLGIISSARIFARNGLVIAVPRGNPARIESLRDLPKAQRIVLGAIAVPIGHYSEEVLGKGEAAYGAGFKAKVIEHVVSRELNAKEVIAKVSLGEVDAALIYRTDVAPGIEIVPIPRELNIVARYPIATKAQPSALASEFVDFVLSREGQSILEASGFLPP